MPNSIFINYRQADSPSVAYLLYRELTSRFESSEVFMDLEITLGDDYKQYLQDKLKTCKVLIAVIGKEWLNIKNPDGKRRLDEPSDLVRLEIKTALDRGISTIPVIAPGAKLPKKKDLPKPLKPLVDRQALFIKTSNWNDDIIRLVENISKITGLQEKKISGSSISSNYILKQGDKNLINALKKHKYQFGWSNFPFKSEDKGKPIESDITEITVVKDDFITMKYLRKDGIGTLKASISEQHLFGMWKDIDGEGEVDINFESDYSRGSGWWNRGGQTMKYNAFFRRVG
ncbi:MAG: toll/interleukin-1 receptor domain-containing protein [Methanomassiliicoccales archaeon]|nr:MAG: toll/interleukin-1 receptor domain-containing protein [Methanomassiliicoccales archaeon]